MTAPEPGIHFNVPHAVYHSWQLPSFSSLKHFADDQDECPPAKAKAMMDAPVDPSPAMEAGDFIDAVLLEPERLTTDFVARPDVDRRTKEGKAAWAAFEAENAGKAIIAADLYDDAEHIQEALWQHPVASALSDPACRKQVALVWDCPQMGMRLKGRLDAITQWRGWSVIIDLKSVDAKISAGRRRWGAQAARMKWLMQASMYLDGLNTLAPFSRRFAWVVIERSPPYLVADYWAGPDALEIGRSQYLQAAGVYLDCLNKGVWPGYPGGQDVHVPRWAEIKEMVD